MLLFLTFCTLFVVGCGAKAKDLIVGKWDYVEGGDRKGQKIEFANDGTVTLDVYWAGPIGKPGVVSEPMPQKGKYKLTEDEIIEIDVPGVTLIKGKVRATMDELTITDAQGNVSKLKRATRESQTGA